MNASKAVDAIEQNKRLFAPYARKLASDNLDEYTTFSDKFAKWLADPRAYYPAARPEILKLLKIASATLQRNARVNTAATSLFNISQCLDHPMVGPYSQLLRAVSPHRQLFAEPEMFAEIKTLLKTVQEPPMHIDLTSEPNSPVAATHIVPTKHPPQDNVTMQLPQTNTVNQTPQTSVAIPPPPALKVKKKKKKASLGLESLIQVDIQDLQKTTPAHVAPVVKTEIIETFPDLFSEHRLQSGGSVDDPIILDDDDEVQPVNAHVKTAPLPSSSSDMHLETSTLPTLQTKQLDQQSANVPDVDMVDGDGTTPIDALEPGPPRSIIHGWAPGLLKPDSFKLWESMSPQASTTDSIAKARMVQIDTAVINIAPAQVVTPSVNTSPVIPDMASLQENPFVTLSCAASSSPEETLKIVPLQTDSQSLASLSAPKSVDAPPLAISDFTNTSGNTLTAPFTTSNGHIDDPMVGQGGLHTSEEDQRKATPTIQNDTSGEQSIPQSSTLPFADPPRPKPTLVYPPPPDDKKYTAEELKALHAFGSDTRILVVLKGEKKKPLKSKITFDISKEQFKAIERWNNRRNPTEDISLCICVSMACYSREIVKSEQKRIDQLSDLPIQWPNDGTLRMNVMHKNKPIAIPLSPPFKLGPNGLVDISKYMCLEKNILELEQFDDMSAHIFVLRVHQPTNAQINETMRRRNKDRLWDDWRREIAQPMNLSFSIPVSREVS